MTNPTEAARLRAALKRIAYLRPAGDVETAKNTRALVEQIERIALEALQSQPSEADAELVERLDRAIKLEECVPQDVRAHTLLGVAKEAAAALANRGWSR